MPGLAGTMKSVTRGINHLGFAVRDLDQTTRFFVQALGWQEAGRDDSYPRAAVTDGKVRLTLWQVDNTQEIVGFDRRKNVGLHHLALEVDSELTLQEIASVLDSYPGATIEFKPELVGTGPRKHMMCNEPGGLRIEFIWPGDVAPEPGDHYNPMVPELVVRNLAKSLEFYSLLGFSIKYEREEDRFVYLELDRVNLMLEEISASSWITSDLETPYGRGINFQIEVSGLDDLVARLKKRNLALFKDIEERWYRAGNFERGLRQFLVQDPDGYLLRFNEVIGTRPCNT